MRVISLILSLGMIGVGIYGLAISADQGYWLGALIVGVIWLIVDIIKIKSKK